MTTTLNLLGHRALITIRGETAETFLQNLVSQDVIDIPGQTWRYAALLTPQGKFLHDMFITRHDGLLWLDVDRERRDDLMKRLMMFRLRQKLDLALQDDHIIAWSASDLPETGPVVSFAAPDPRHAQMGQRCLLPASSLADCSTDLSDYHHKRLSLAIGEAGVDIWPDKDTLAEHHFEAIHGVSYTKGCYVGQEVNARMKHRGLLKKSLRCLAIEGDPPVSGQAIFKNDQEVSVLRSVFGSLALAMLRHRDLDHPLTLEDGRTIDVLPLPESHKLSD